MLVDDGVILADATGGEIEVLLPSLPNASGLKYDIKRINDGGNKVIILSLNQIEMPGISGLHIKQKGTSLTFTNDGSIWYII